MKSPPIFPDPPLPGPDEVPRHVELSRSFVPLPCTLELTRSLLEMLGRTGEATDEGIRQSPTADALRVIVGRSGAGKTKTLLQQLARSK
jgi:ABC-type transport system involved in cytochrome bd biosynthesis fused ATPase/permease subunit